MTTTFPTAAELAGLVPTLARLADQADVIAAAHEQALAAGRPAADTIAPEQRAAWLRVLLSFAKAEGLEGCFMDPAMHAVADAGLGDPEILRFFRSQASDEVRHLGMLETYVTEQYGPQPIKTSLMTGLLYDHVFAAMVRGAMQQPLLLLVPIYMLEKVGSLYLARLARCAGDAGLPVLQSLLQEVHRDEARHVAGVGLTLKALLPHRPPTRRERWLLKGIARLVVIDMDRDAWWKRGLRSHMSALGLDAQGMNRDNALVYAEICRMLDGQESPDGDRYAAV